MCGTYGHGCDRRRPVWCVRAREQWGTNANGSAQAAPQVKRPPRQRISPVDPASCVLPCFLSAVRSSDPSPSPQHAASVGGQNATPLLALFSVSIPSMSTDHPSTPAAAADPGKKQRHLAERPECNEEQQAATHVCLATLPTRARIGVRIPEAARARSCAVGEPCMVCVRALHPVRRRRGALARRSVAHRGLSTRAPCHTSRIDALPCGG